MKKIHVALVIPFVLIALGYLYVLFLLPLRIPSLPSSRIILDTAGEEIGETVYSGSIRHRNITFGEIPEFYRASLIQLEDRSFYANSGIDLRGIVRSTIHNIQAGRVVEGASTLSAQFIRNALWINESRSLSRKILESLYALRLNRVYSKEEILTLYVNRIAFGHLNYGLKSAARYYFGKEPRNLTKAEQIALLLIPKNPKRYDPYTAHKPFDERFRMIVSVLQNDGGLSEQEARSILTEKLTFNTHHADTLPYVVDFIHNLSETPWTHSVRSSPLSGGQDSISPPWQGGYGGLINTTFDLALTKKIEGIARSAIDELSWRNVSDYGVLIAERPSPSSPHPSPLPEGEGIKKNTNSPLPLGEGLGVRADETKLRVMIGWVDYHTGDAGQVNSTLALRQPGSTIKPFTYLLAFQNLGLTPTDTILDLPVQYKTAEDYSYEPKNYALGYRGQVTLAEALSQSINIPAIKLAEQVGVENLLTLLHSLGITSLDKDAEHYGLALTLGDGEVSLYELLQAYSIFANEGEFCSFQIYSPIQSPHPSPLPEGEGTKCTQITDSKYTDMIDSILTDRYAKLHGFPIGSPLDFADRNVFVKTGTSRNFRDNWAIGFTDHYMIGVWTGNKNAENMKGVSGATGAGEIFSRIVYALELSETEQKPHNLEAKKPPYLEITSPLSGSVYRIDPAKPLDLQAIKAHFASNIPYDTSSWLLDGKTLSGSIAPTVGAHTLEIVLMKDGAIVQKEKSTFHVESAP